MKKIVLILVFAVVAIAVADPVKNKEDIGWNEEHRRTVRAASPYVQYHASYGPPARYARYYGTLRFGNPSSTYYRPRAYYQQPGISYRYVRRPTGIYKEQFGFNVYGSPIVYSSYHV